MDAQSMINLWYKTARKEKLYWIGSKSYNVHSQYHGGFGDSRSNGISSRDIGPYTVASFY